MFLSDYILRDYSATVKEKTGFYIFYAPMGSGKTYYIKQLLKFYKDKQISIIAPYRSCREDYGYIFNENPTYSSPFLYTNQLIRIFTKSTSFQKSNSKQETAATFKMFLKNLDFDWGKILYIIDEYDFTWLQANREFTPIVSGHIHSDELLRVFYTFVQKQTLILGFTATRPPYRYRNIGTEIVCTDVTTSVTFNAFKIIGTNGIKSAESLKQILQDYVKNNIPTLVYKKRYTTEDINTLLHIANTYNKKVLVVLRKENAPKIAKKGQFNENIIHKKLNNITRTDKKILLKPTGKDFMLVDGIDTALDIAINGDDVFSAYDIVFINLSSSRQVSLQEQQNGIPVNVVCQGASIDAHMLQASARFRHNPVELTIILNSTTKSKLKQITSNTIEDIAPCSSSYNFPPPIFTVEYLGSLGVKIGKAIGKAKGKAVGKAISDTTKQKNQGIVNHLDTYTINKLCTSVAVMHKDYVNYCKQHNLPYYTYRAYIDKVKNILPAKSNE